MLVVSQNKHRYHHPTFEQTTSGGIDTIKGFLKVNKTSQ